MYSASARAVGRAKPYNNVMGSFNILAAGGVSRADRQVSPAPRSWLRFWQATGLAVLAVVLAVTFRAWLQPDMLLELANTVFCS